MKVRIRIQGRLDKKWSSWFDNLNIDHYCDYTEFSGAIIDQSELHGILNKIRDLNLKLISLKSEII